MTATELAPKAIMVVDDESDILFVFKMSLERAGFSVSTFTTAADALEHFKLNKDRYGLIISDVRMPSIGGIEFASKVREFDASIPFLLMSAFEIAVSQIDPTLNISQFLQKPIMPSQLIVIVSKYLSVTAK